MSTFTIGQPFNPYKQFNGSFIPEAVSRYKGLSPGAKLIYGRFCRYGGEDAAVYPALATVAEETGLSATQARVYARELEREGFIRIERANGVVSHYVFLYHPAFDGERGSGRKAPPLRKTAGVPLRISKGVTPTENHMGTPTDIQRGPLRKTAAEESQQESQFKESPSSSVVGTLAPEQQAVVLAEPIADDLSFRDSEKTKTLGEMIDWARGLLRTARYGADAETHVQPDKKITESILGQFSDILDFEEWATDGDIQNALARKAKSPGWGLWERDAQNRAGDIGAVRLAREKAAMDAEADEERKRATEEQKRAEHEALMSTAVDPTEAVRIATEAGIKIPKMLAKHLEQTGTPVSPMALIAEATGYQRCSICGDSGSTGKALDGNLRLCSCMAGSVKECEAGADWPERETAAVNSDLRSRMTAAALNLAMPFTADSLGDSDVTETSEEVVVRAPDRSVGFGLDLRDLKKILIRLGDQRRVSIAIGRKETAAA